MKKIEVTKLKDFECRKYGKEKWWSKNLFSVRNYMSTFDASDHNLIIFVGRHRKQDIYELSGLGMDWVICKIGHLKKQQYLYIFRRCGDKGISELRIEQYQDLADQALRLDRKSNTPKTNVRVYNISGSDISMSVFNPYANS